MQIILPISGLSFSSSGDFDFFDKNIIRIIIIMIIKHIIAPNKNIFFPENGDFAVFFLNLVN